MELVLKLPKNKPPFIGVLFNYENVAASLNKDWAESNRTHTLELILEPSQKLYIKMLHGDHFSERYEVSYDPVDLLKFLHQTKDCKLFSFGHLQLKDGKFKIPKTRAQGVEMLFKIDKIRVQMLTVSD